MNTLKRKKCWGSAPKKKLNSNENRYDILQSYEDDDTFSEDEEESKEYKVVVPPIVVDDTHGFSTVVKLMGKDYDFKRMSIGTKIISPTIQLYDNAMKKLKTFSFKYYSHESKDTKLFKLFLYGLPRIDLKLIEDELKSEYNVSPVSIKEIATVRSSQDDALYMLEFDKTQNSKAHILKIKRLCSIVIYWRNPLKSKKGPTQCTKCAMYGHGSKNCYRNNICIGCGGDHDWSVCQVSKIPDGKQPAYKCFNCTKKNLKNTSHRADDPRCPSRKEYLIMRENINRKNRPSQIQVNNLFEQSSTMPAHSLNTPCLRNEDNAPHAARSYADAVRLPQMTSSSDRGLFSIDELFNIFTRAVSDLQKCSSKIEQLNVIMQMLKYAI